MNLAILAEDSYIFLIFTIRGVRRGCNYWYCVLRSKILIALQIVMYHIMHRTNIISLIVMTALLFIVLLALEPQIGPRVSYLRAEPKSSL